MEMSIELTGGVRVDAKFGDYVIHTDQPLPKGDGSAPSPFEVFLASIGTCAGFYVANFCRERGIPTDGIRLIQRGEKNPHTSLIEHLSIEVLLPPDFPAKYKEAVIRAANQCLVKKHLEHPPRIDVVAHVAEPDVAV
jgi:ribosomal protein S12 methylthiotransferase accessory factor